MKQLATGFLLAVSLLLGGCASLLQVPGEVRAEIRGVGTSAPPGGTLTAQIVLQAQNFSGPVAVVLTAPSGFTLEAPTGPVNISGDRTTVDVRVRVGEGVAPGSYTLRFRVQPQGLDPIFLEVQVQVVPPEPQRLISLTVPEGTLSLRQGEETSFSITVRNDTTSPLRVQLIVNDRDDRLSFPSGGFFTLSLPAGGQASQEVRVAARGDAGSGTLYIQAIALRDDTPVSAASATIPYTVTPYNLSLSASPAQGTVSEENPTIPSTTVAYRSSGVRGVFVVESRTSGWTVSPSYVEIREGSGSFSLSLRPSSSLGPGTYTVNLRLFRDNYEVSLPVQVTLSSFTLGLGSTSITANPTASLPVALTPQAGYSADRYVFTLEGASASQFALSPTEVSAPGNHTLTLTPVVGTPTGTYTLTLKAQAPGVVRRASFQITVASPDYTATLNPTSLSVYQGQTQTASLSITPQGGFSGNLTALVADSSGSPIPWLTVSPDTFNVSGPQTYTLTFSASGSAPVGTYNLVLRLLGSVNKNVPFTLQVLQPTFHIALDTTSFTLNPGDSASAVLTLTTEGGFTGTIGLALQGTGASDFTLTPTSINTGASAWGITLTASPTVGSGTYNLFLVATSGSITRMVPITVTVP